MAIHLAALSWALIFILRLRFPPGKSIAKVITDRYDKATLLASDIFNDLTRSWVKPSWIYCSWKVAKPETLSPNFFILKSQIGI